MAKTAKEPRPERVTREHIAVMDKAPLKAVLKDIPAHYVEAHRNKNTIRSCCQNIENLRYQAFKTEGDLQKPDLAVMECGECGAKHYRVAQGPGRLGQ